MAAASGPAPDLSGGTPVAFSRVTLSRVMEAGDANLHGNVHGGVIMHMVDTAAGAAAHRHSRGPAVTAVMDEMAFLAPVRLGDIVTCQASVNWAGQTSMEVGVRVSTQRWDDAASAEHHVASAYLVFVAVGPDEAPRPVPGLLPQSAAEHRRVEEAQIRRQSRLARRAAIESHRAAGQPATDTG